MSEITYDLLIVGAGPAGIALAVEAKAAGVEPSRTLILEKAEAHSWTIRQFYPERKMTTANYKGHEARGEGRLSFTDMTKPETLEFFDRVVTEHGLNIGYGAEVFAMRPAEGSNEARFRVAHSQGESRTRVLAVAIGILGRPNRPKEYPLPPTLKGRLLFDITSQRISGEEVLVVGGGDTAAEYAQILSAAGNQVTLSYRGAELTRMSAQNRDALARMQERREIVIQRNSNVARVEDEGGKPRVYFREEEGGAARGFDRVVYALGGTTPTNFLRMLGLEFNEDGPVTDEAGETNVPGLFLIGDLVVGRTGGSIMTAFNSSARAMGRICARFLRCGDGPRSR